MTSLQKFRRKQVYTYVWHKTDGNYYPAILAMKDDCPYFPLLELENLFLNLMLTSNVIYLVVQVSSQKRAEFKFRGLVVCYVFMKGNQRS